MATGHVYIACSLDGFIARPDGGIDWLMADPPSDLMDRYAAFMADKDAIVMGRATFDIVRAFDPWPYDVPVVVLSRSLSPADLPPALAGKVRLDPAPRPRSWRASPPPAAAAPMSTAAPRSAPSSPRA